MTYDEWLRNQGRAGLLAGEARAYRRTALPPLAKTYTYRRAVAGEVTSHENREACDGVRLAARELGIPEPELRWFMPVARPREGEETFTQAVLGWACERTRTVNLIAGQTDPFSTACHETRHVSQFLWGQEADEEPAWAFESRMRRLRAEERANPLPIIYPRHTPWGAI